MTFSQLIGLITSDGRGARPRGSLISSGSPPLKPKMRKEKTRKKANDGGARKKEEGTRGETSYVKVLAKVAPIGVRSGNFRRLIEIKESSSPSIAVQFRFVASKRVQ